MNTLALGGFNNWLHDFWFKPGNSDLAHDVDGLFMFILWVCIISFVGLMTAMCWWAFKYRRRPGVPAQRTPNHNTMLEVTWVVGPLIVVTVIFFWGFRGYMRAQVASSNAEVVSLSARKWAWSTLYANGAQSGEGVFMDTVVLDKDVVRRGNEKVPVFVVPAGRPVQFKMSSEDVIHSFFIPDMRIKMDVFPNRYTSLTFTPQSGTRPDQAGTLYADPTMAMAAAAGMGTDHYIFCAEYCGNNHSEMAAILRVLPEEEYIATIKDWANVADEYGDGTGKKGPRKPLWQYGEWLHANKSCASCHSVDGKAGTGPSWKGFYGTPVKWADGASLSTSTYPGTANLDDAWAQYIRESIINPNAHIHEGFSAAMPSFAGQFGDKEISAFVAYFRKLAGRSDSVAPTDAKPDAAKPAEPKK